MGIPDSYSCKAEWEGAFIEHLLCTQTYGSTM